MKRIALLLIAASCSPVPRIVCETRCGTQWVELQPDYYSPDDSTEWTCDGLQEAEDKFLPLVQDLYPRACEALQVQLTFHPDSSWDFYGSQVAGLTFCPMGVVELSSLNLRVSAYAHEMLHVMQGCVPQLPVDEGQDLAHGDWVRNGFNGIINRWLEAMAW